MQHPRQMFISTNVGVATASPTYTKPPPLSTTPLSFFLSSSKWRPAWGYVFQGHHDAMLVMRKLNSGANILLRANDCAQLSGLKSLNLAMSPDEKNNFKITGERM